MAAGIPLGRRPELVGGGLIRSLGGWTAVQAWRTGDARLKGDERILGDSPFVLDALKASDEQRKRQDKVRRQGYDVEKLARKPYLTRASVTNAAYVAPGLKIEGKPDPVRLEVFYDAQTSGGMLISVPADRAEALVETVRKKGGRAACVIGEVAERGESAIVLRP